MRLGTDSPTTGEGEVTTRTTIPSAMASASVPSAAGLNRLGSIVEAIAGAAANLYALRARGSGRQ